MIAAGDILMPPGEAAEWLKDLAAEGVIAGFDLHWAAFLRRLAPEAPPGVVLAGVLARAAIDRGHLCLDLQQPLLPPELAARYPELAADCRADLAVSPLVGNGRAAERTPLVLDRNRLYLFRYWQYETRLAENILARAGGEPAGAGEEGENESGRAALAELTAAAGIALASDQERAILTALSRRLAVIAGGPGTGKTTIVFFILALLQTLALQAGRPPLRMLLLAPTGKAAARLAQAVQEKARLLAGSAAVRAALPGAAMTIHRALGFQWQAPTVFRHNRKNPLAADLVVVDEASMVDVALMSKLLAAVPEAARLVLLGDKDQLASVEAGSILGDICQAAESSATAATPAAAGLAAPSSPLAACVVQLRQGFRFAAERGIGGLTRAINAGDGEAVMALLNGPAGEGVSLVDAANLLRDEGFRKLVVAGFRDFLAAAAPVEALTELNRFRLLCAHRRGPAGVEQLNRFCEQTLAAAGLLRPHGEWYHGRPLLITANHYELRLFNGDLGVIRDEADGQGPRACFLDDRGNLRSLAPGRLPAHETAFAMTIHKSQGSEFDEVAVILPPEVSPLLTRELLYTAVSRARREVRIFGREAVIRQTVATRLQRISGLADRL